MALTHAFKETVRARAKRDSEFRQAFLRDAVASILNGDLAARKAVLRSGSPSVVNLSAILGARESATIPQL